MKLFQDAKEQDLFPSHSVCLQLLNFMAKTGQTEHFESGAYFVSRQFYLRNIKHFSCFSSISINLAAFYH